MFRSAVGRSCDKRSAEVIASSESANILTSSRSEIRRSQVDQVQYREILQISDFADGTVGTQ